ISAVLHAFPTRRSSDLKSAQRCCADFLFSSFKRGLGQLQLCGQGLGFSNHLAHADVQAVFPELGVGRVKTERLQELLCFLGAARSEEHTSELQSRENPV